MENGLAEEDILLIKKPRGITSFDVVRKIRTRLGVKKVGHAGTLDPMAEGLLIVGIGSGTKKLGRFLKLPKSYKAQVFFGTRTDTGDCTGKVLEEKEISEIDPDVFRRCLKGLLGKLVIPVPAYSAIKVQGRKLYTRARRGEVFTPPVREMEIIKIELLKMTSRSKGVEAELLIHVSSGTYIRSIAEELGRRLGLPATLSGLTRETIGNYLLEDAVEVGDLKSSYFSKK